MDTLIPVQLTDSVHTLNHVLKITVIHPLCCNVSLSPAMLFVEMPNTIDGFHLRLSRHIDANLKRKSTIQ